MAFNTVPTNYEGVPAVPRRVGTPPQTVAHDRLLADRISGSIRLALRTIDPVRVGQGSYEPRPPRALVQDVISRNGVPILPGSSLKGVVRSLLEAIYGGCDPSDPCHPPCVACSLFGFVGGRDREMSEFMGRVGIEDALPLDAAAAAPVILKVPRAFAPRRRVGRRIYGPAPAGVEPTVAVLAVPRGVVFETRVVVRNVSNEELGQVLRSAGADATFAPRVGGGKFYGFGRVAVRAREAHLRLDGYRSPPMRLDGDALAAATARWIEAAPVSAEGSRVLDLLRRQMPAEGATGR